MFFDDLGQKKDKISKNVNGEKCLVFQLIISEQEIKIAICGRVLLCSWFYVVNLPFG